MKPFVSIIVPCRNEEWFLNGCLQSLLNQDYPHDRMEIIVVDGMSTDGTWGIAEHYREVYGTKLTVNPGGIKSAGVNRGIQESKGERVMIADAHASYPPEYVSECVGQDAENVGGVCAEVPQGDGIMGKALTLVRTEPFGVLRGE